MNLCARSTLVMAQPTDGVIHKICSFVATKPTGAKAYLGEQWTLSFYWAMCSETRDCFTEWGGGGGTAALEKKTWRRSKH